MLAQCELATADLAECEEASHAGGLAAGLTAAFRGVDALAPPGQIAAFPSAMVAAGAVVMPHQLAADEGISFIHSGAPPASGTELTRFGARLGAVRLGGTRRLLAAATTHLAGRQAGGEPTIRKQLVLGTLADAATAIDAARQCLLVAEQLPAAVTDTHDRLNALDWELAKLFGGSGYLTNSPTRSAYVARLVANCWIAQAAESA